MIGQGIYFIYNVKNIDKNNKLFGCIALVVDNNSNITNYKITFETANDISIKQKWPWMFRNKKNETHIWLNQLNENSSKRIFFDKHLEIFNKLMEEEFDKRSKTIDIPQIFYFNTNDIYNYLKKQNKEIEPSPAQVEFFKNWLILKIALFFESNPEKTFEFPLYKEYINNNPQIMEMNPEYSVESFIMDVNEGIIQVENLIT